MTSILSAVQQVATSRIPFGVDNMNACLAAYQSLLTTTATVSMPPPPPPSSSSSLSLAKGAVTGNYIRLPIAREEVLVPFGVEIAMKYEYAMTRQADFSPLVRP